MKDEIAGEFQVLQQLVPICLNRQRSDKSVKKTWWGEEWSFCIAGEINEIQAERTKKRGGRGLLELGHKKTLLGKISFN